MSTLPTDGQLNLAGLRQSITKKILDANIVLEITLLPRKPRLLDWTGDL